MKVLLLNGSASEVSHTEALLAELKVLLEKNGIDVYLWNLQEKQIPFALPEFHHNPDNSPYPVVRKFAKRIKESDGIILGTPLYHGSFSGLLKNALDNLPSDAFKGKIVGLVSNAGGMPNTQPVEHLRSIVRTMYGYTTQTQIVTSEDDYFSDGDGYKINNQEIYSRAKRLTQEMIWLMSSLRNTKLQLV